MVAVAPRPTVLPAPLADIEVARAERRLHHFIRQAWHLIEPGTPYHDNWHIHAICAHLEAVLDGRIRNLLINMPPRAMKSIAVSVMFPAWAWIRRPELRFLYSSYSSDLATDHSVATRRIIESDWYQERWGDRFQLAGDANLKTRFENDRRGYRFSTSVGGAATGLGGDIVVVDDPHSVTQAESDAIRTSTLAWWDKTMASRLNDQKTGARIIVMQRVHEDDLSGHVLAQGGYEHLVLPMEYEPTDRVTGIGWRDPRTEEGELLDPKRFGPAEVADLKVRLGSLAYAGQYQQRPTPATGGILRRDWWRFYDAAPLQFDWLLQSWDTAFKTGQESDWSVGLTIGLAGQSVYLLDRWRGRADFPTLKRVVQEQYLRWRPDELAIEDAASGQSLIQELLAPFASPAEWQMTSALPIVAVRPDRDKVARANAVSPHLEAGRICLPKGAAWADELIEECAAFPFGRHDDQVDALTQGVLRLVARAQQLRPLDPAIVAAFEGLPA